MSTAYFIQASLPENPACQWSADLEAPQFRSLLEAAKSAPCLSPFQAAVLTTRTNTLYNTALDTALPLFQTGLKARDVANYPFIMVAWLAIDILTLPFRLVTLIPRAIYNLFPARHPMLQLMQQLAPVDPQLLKAQTIELHISLVKRQSQWFGLRSAENLYFWHAPLDIRAQTLHPGRYYGLWNANDSDFPLLPKPADFESRVLAASSSEDADGWQVDKRRGWVFTKSTTKP